MRELTLLLYINSLMKIGVGDDYNLTDTGELLWKGMTRFASLRDPLDEWLH
jgi:hypothetical protein